MSQGCGYAAFRAILCFRRYLVRWSSLFLLIRLTQLIGKL